MKISVVIPVKNRLDLTAPLVRRLKGQGGYETLSIYDNGSTDDTASYLRGKGVHVLDASAMGLHEMWNRAAEEGMDGDAVVFLNNDLELDSKPDWLTRLCAPLADGWAATCPNYDRRQHYAPVEQVRGVCGGRYDGTGGLAGFAFAVASRIFRDGYRFPTEAKWWYGDTDFARTMEAQDEPMGVVIDCGVTHVHGGSQTAKDYDLAEQCQRDKDWFEGKWGAVHV